MTEDLQTRAETPGAGCRACAAGVMGGGELAAQAIANIAPSAVIAFTAAAIYTTASNGTWISFALATVVILSVGYCISQFAKRRSSAGSLYSLCRDRTGTVRRLSDRRQPDHRMLRDRRRLAERLGGLHRHPAQPTRHSGPRGGRTDRAGRHPRRAGHLVHHPRHPALRTGFPGAGTDLGVHHHPAAGLHPGAPRERTPSTPTSST